jgi:hypothetical protein
VFGHFGVAALECLQRGDMMVYAETLRPARLGHVAACGRRHQDGQVRSK